jgi:hypothetical protein
MAELSWPEIIRENESETNRMEALCQKMTESDLAVTMEAGWTVSAVLAHLAFWDVRAIKLIEWWRQKGVEYSALDTDLINEVTREIFIHLPGRTAAKFTLEQARKLDKIISELDPAMIEKINQIGKNVRLQRYLHRRTHLDEIELAITKSK